MDNIFLILSLFLPRITILIYYFSNSIPLNSVPFLGDILLSIFLPRVLILIYIADNFGIESPWFWIHLVAALFVYSGSGKYIKKKRFRKKS